ncbi:Arc family DNA-binding protein [[Clostridium] colinum]|uniref:Arc family DNA-binding protein n=1 Tax=[Clostridium] colinum TaxID=36835 RepID=UPI00202455B9|nr:Arc family DNA-binding protein [[Clostridium] colinum]
MSKQANPYPLRIEKQILEKSKYIAKNNGRSLNKEIEFILKNNIQEYEQNHGEIIIPQDTSKEQ